MTICIAAHFGEFVALAADTRTTLGRPAISFEDGSKKVHETSMGIATGSGWADLLDLVYNQLSNREITHSDQILRIIMKEAQSAKEHYPHDHTDLIKMTGWLYTYLGIENDETLIRLCQYHGSMDNESHSSHYRINAGNGCVWVDAQFSVHSTYDYSDYFTNKMSELPINSEFEEKVEFFLKTAKLLVSHASFYHESVSQEFSFGLHLVDGTRIIKDPIQINSEPIAEIDNHICSIRQA